MVPFPFLRRNNRREHRFFCVAIKQVGTSAKRRNRCGYYRIENNMLIGKNGQISIYEFMKEMARAWKSKEINSKHCAQLLEVCYRGMFRLGLYDYCNKIIIVSSAGELHFFRFHPLNICSFLTKENFLRTVPLLLFENERYLGVEYS